jgi:hypothetical protein
MKNPLESVGAEAAMVTVEGGGDDDEPPENNKYSKFLMMCG